MSMKISEVGEKLQAVLDDNFGTGVFSVGCGKDILYVYEHKRGYAKRRVRPQWIPENITVIYKYIGSTQAL